MCIECNNNSKVLGFAKKQLGKENKGQQTSVEKIHNEDEAVLCFMIIHQAKECV